MAGKDTLDKLMAVVYDLEQFKSTIKDVRFIKIIDDCVQSIDAHMEDLEFQMDLGDWAVVLHEDRKEYCYCVIENKDENPCRIARRGATLDEALQNCYAAIRGQDVH